MKKKHRASVPFIFQRVQNKDLYEGGNIIDQMGSLIVMMFCFALIFAMICYGKMVEMKLSIDEVCKTYLYQMEQEGCLTNDKQQEMVDDLTNIGVRASSISLTGTTNLGEINQAAYGDTMNLICSVKFTNPLYTMLARETKGDDPNLPFVIESGVLSPEISYTADMTATAKW